MQSKEDIYRILRAEIIEGKLNPGERLIEKELCERLETTRGYVREALKLLGAHGFVILSHGKGAMVAKISYQETKELYEILSALEAKSVELAGPNLTKADLNTLTEINKTLKKCINAEDRVAALKTWQDSNLEFHRIFAARSGNRELKSMLESIRWRTFDFRYVYLFDPKYKFFSDQHDSLIAAIKKKQFVKAKKIMEDHIDKASLVVLQSLEKSPD